MLLVGIDWAERHHDVCVMAADGQVLAVERITDTDGVADVGRLHELIAERVSEPAEVVVGIKTDCGLLVERWSRPATRWFSARGLADRITCPTPVLDAEDDFASDGQADQLAADLTCPLTRHRLTRADGTAGHSGGLGQQRLAQIIFDRLDTALAGPHRPLAPAPSPRADPPAGTPGDA